MKKMGEICLAAPIINIVTGKAHEFFTAVIYRPCEIKFPEQKFMKL
jgi:hypothetical protein